LADVIILDDDGNVPEGTQRSNAQIQIVVSFNAPCAIEPASPKQKVPSTQPYEAIDTTRPQLEVVKSKPEDKLRGFRNKNRRYA